MSQAEAAKWEARYAASDAPPGAPSDFIAHWIARLPTGPALDLGCGTGRHALALARAGFAVTGVDVSPAALARAARQAHAEGLTVAWHPADLDDYTLPAGHYAVIVNCQILKRALMAQYATALRPGGAVIVEQHLHTARPVAGPGPQYRLKPGELPGLLHGLRVVHYEETLRDPEPTPGPSGPAGLPTALVRAVAVRDPWVF
jgi:tellurite methyltransferase